MALLRRERTLPILIVTAVAAGTQGLFWTIASEPLLPRPLFQLSLALLLLAGMAHLTALAVQHVCDYLGTVEARGVAALLRHSEPPRRPPLRSVN